MDIFTATFWVIGLSLMGWSLYKSKKKTFMAVKKTKKMMGSMMGDIVAIIFIIGLVLTILPPESIEQVLGDSRIFLTTVISGLVGSITLIPAFVAFPLIGSLADAGANIVPLVAFLTTLTMVGVVTFPLEKKEFGLKFALSRNVLSFLFALLIALSMGVVL